MELIRDLLHKELLQVDVGADLTEEEEELELLPVLVGELLEARVAFLKGFLCIDAHLADIAEGFRLHGRLEVEDLIVDVLQLRVALTTEVLLLQRAEDRLDIVQLEDALIIVDEKLAVFAIICLLYLNGSFSHFLFACIACSKDA